MGFTGAVVPTLARLFAIALGMPAAPFDAVSVRVKSSLPDGAGDGEGHRYHSISVISNLAQLSTPFMSFRAIRSIHGRFAMVFSSPMITSCVA